MSITATPAGNSATAITPATVAAKCGNDAATLLHSENNWICTYKLLVTFTLPARNYDPWHALHQKTLYRILMTTAAKHSEAHG